MRIGRVIALIVVVAIICIALGDAIGTGVSSEKTTTITQTAKNSILTQTNTVTTTTFLGNSSTTTISNSSSKNFPFNETYGLYINYSGAWGLSYQTRLGTNVTSGALVQSGNYFGHSPMNETINIMENETLLIKYGYNTCFQAQKLDNSSSMLVFGFTSSNSQNETSKPFGKISLCLVNIYSPTADYSSNLSCAETFYALLASISITIQNSTTLTLSSTDFTSTGGQTTFTTETNTTQIIGYTTTYTSYSPPSGWAVLVCTYVG